MKESNEKLSEEKAKMTIDLIASNMPMNKVYDIIKKEFKDELFVEIESSWGTFFDAVCDPNNDSNGINALVYNSRLDALAKLAIKEFNPNEKDERAEFLARQLLIIQSSFLYDKKKKLLLETEGSEKKVHSTVMAAGIESALVGNTYRLNKINEMLEMMKDEAEFK